MKLRSLKLAGFRGFNSERSVTFSDRLTVIAAPNSHGKTSISEAFEFLLYGSTSKVDKADSKEEYRDSYRNRHFPANEPAYIEAVLQDASGSDHTLRVELDADGSTRRSHNGKSVLHLPFQSEALVAARPFVLQHALKCLLLVPPAERFNGFARLIGLAEVEAAFQALLALCTKPTASLPPEAQQLLTNLDVLRERMTGLAGLKKAAAHLRRGMAGVADFFSATTEFGDSLLARRPTPADRLTKLRAARDAAAAKVYSGSVGILADAPDEANAVAAAEKTLAGTVSAALLEDYGRLAAGAAAERLRKQVSLLEIGQALLKDAPAACPLCTQALTDDLRAHISSRHVATRAELDRVASFGQSRTRVERAMREARSQITRHYETLRRRTADLVASTEPANEAKVKAVFGEGHEASLSIVREAASAIRPARKSLEDAAQKAEAAIDACDAGLQSGKVHVAQAELLGRALDAYLIAAKEYTGRSAEAAVALTGPSQIFRQALDAAAGTAEMSMVINVLDRRAGIERALRVHDVVEGLRTLKDHVQQTLGETMEAAMSSDLTASVMRWYDRIKTTGDPEVHFSGFALPRTKDGGFKNRTVAVKAKSYGVELSSAVSSLSESKLNALGLCVSIASALRAPGPWRFLIVDDPIQSWDDEHETQFVEVLRALVETEGKQLVVLSHKTTWAKVVCQGCRSLNGIHYEMTGYTKDGPRIVEREWSSLEHRLREAETIANDSGATSDRLQQGEEELRLAACALGAILAKDKLGRVTSPHNLNAASLRLILNEAGVAANAVDRVSAMFVSADDAHHAPKNYQPTAERIRRACASLRDILRSMKSS